MTALRQLSAIYLAAAGAYSVALFLSAHPVVVRDLEIAARVTRTGTGEAAVAVHSYVARPLSALAVRGSEAFGRRVAEVLASHRESSQSRPQVLPAAHPAPLIVEPAPSVGQPPRSLPSSPAVVPPPSGAPVDIASAQPPRSAPPAPSDLRGSETAPQPNFRLAPGPSAPASQTASLPPGVPEANPGDVVRVAERLKDSLTAEMLANFELFLYVSKAQSGPWAQRMYVFKKQPSGDLVLLYNWPVSTGREEIEFNPEGQKLKTDTPAGYYELDPRRSYEHYTSNEWHQPMPYAMFFNWVEHGGETGLAIHAASGDDVTKLGRRASAGCIHLSLDNARTLFTMIRSEYRGLAPRFAVDRRTGTMSNDGILLHDANGNVKLADGYKVLVFIEDYGGENVVAALF